MIYVCIPTTRERRSRLDKCLSYLKDSTLENYTVCLYENQDGGYVPAVKNLLSGINGLVFILNDDMLVSPDCLDRLKTAYDNFRPDGVVQPADNIHQGRIAVSPFGHSRTIKPFLKHYTHNFWDADMAQALKAQNRYRIVPDATLLHEHHTLDPTLKDDTYNLALASYPEDSYLYSQRQKSDIIKT